MFFQTTTTTSKPTMSQPLVLGHFVESTGTTTPSSSTILISEIGSSSALPPPHLEVVSERGREKERIRTRAFSPIRVGSGVKGLFGKKKKGGVAGEGGKVGELGGGGKEEEEEEVLSLGVAEQVEVVGGLVEVVKPPEAAVSRVEEIKVGVVERKDEQQSQEKEEEKVIIKKDELELITPLVEPSLPSSPPQQLTLTPESIVVEDSLTKSSTSNNNNSDQPSFSPAEISLQIKAMLQHSKPDDSSELAPPPNQAHLLALLGRPEVMNGGDRDEDDGEEESRGWFSVWKCLEDASHDSFCSIMVSCDLDFSTPPVVTLASWMDFGAEPVGGFNASSTSTSTSGGGWLPSWPWGKKQNQPVVPNTPVGGGEKVVRVWYPSKTKMSLHATWWGFSIYLPPPIMLVLNDGQVGTLKRISAITTGLTYLIKFLPGLLDLGPGMLVALALLGSLVPMISFIASFIAWTWTTIQSYDKGRGVILSATWLCPLLLITRSWDAPSPPSSSLVDKADEKVVLAPELVVEPPLIVVEEVELIA